MTDENRCASGCAGCEEDCGFNGSGATVTLNLDDGTVEECAVLTIYEAAGHSYIALLPLDENGENQDGEVYIYRFNEGTGMSEPQLENIEDDDEYQAASDGFDAWLDSQEYDDLVYLDEEDEQE